MFLLFFVLIFSLSASESPAPAKKIQLSDEVLDRLNELEKVYKQMLNAGVSREDAAIATVVWQDARYPVVLLGSLGKKDPKTEKKSSRVPLNKEGEE